MTIRLYPVTGALGVEAADDPEFWGKRMEMKPCEVKGHRQDHRDSFKLVFCKRARQLELFRAHKRATDLYIVVPRP